MMSDRNARDPDDLPLGDAELESESEFAASRFFSTPQLEQRLELIQHLLEYSTQVILVLSETGGGKSTLCDEIARRARAEWRVARIDAHAGLEVVDCLREIAASWRLDARARDIARLEEALQRQLLQYERANLTPALLVDDADTLSDACLERILALAQPSDHAPGLHTLMLGVPALAERLSGLAVRAGLRPDIAHAIDIPAFNEVQSAEWLAAQFEGALDLNPRTVQRLHAESGGHPGRLLELAGNVEGAPAVEPDEARATPLPDWDPKHVIAGVVVVALAFGVGWLATRDEPEPAPVAVRIDLPAPATVPDAEAPIPLPAPAPATDSSVDLGDEAAPGIEDYREGLPAEPAPVAAIPEPAPVPAQTMAPALQSAPAQTAAPALQSAPAQTAAPALKSAPAPAPKATAAPPPVATPATPSPEVKPKPAPPPRVDKAPAGVKSAAWLRQQKPERYVLQLFASYEQPAAIKFIRDHQLGSEAAWFTTTHNGKPWHVVTYGLYSSRDAANVATTALPSRLQALKPWARSIENIQQSMR